MRLSDTTQYRVSDFKKIISDENSIKEFINKHSVNLKTVTGYTLLHVAIMFNDKMIPFLLKNDADINIRDTHGLTPLHYATKSNPKIVPLLLKKGAEINMKDNNEWSTLHFAARFNPELSPLFIKEKANINSQNKNGWTPLHMIVATEPTQIPLFLKNGAKLNIQNKEGKTPLHFATRFNSKAVNFLLDAKMNIKDNDGFTPLYYALKFNVETVPLLLNAGANPNFGKSLKLEFKKEHERYAFLIYAYGYEKNLLKFDKNKTLNNAFEIYFKLYETKWENVKKSSTKGAAAKSSKSEVDLAEPSASTHFSERTIRLIMEQLYGLPVNHKIYDVWRRKIKTRKITV